MKKIILLFLLTISSQSVEALSIKEVTLSPINSNDINIHLKSNDGNYYFLFSSNYSIASNLITLNVCYTLTASPTITTSEDDFIISAINDNISNYDIEINLYYTDWSTGQEFCSSMLQDSTTIQFATPLKAPLVLSNDAFDQQNNFIIYPNPNYGSFSLQSSEGIKLLEIYDLLGKKLYSLKVNSTNPHITTNIQKGNYLLYIITNSQRQMSAKLIIE